MNWFRRFWISHTKTRVKIVADHTWFKVGAIGYIDGYVYNSAPYHSEVQVIIVVDDCIRCISLKDFTVIP